MVSDVKIERCKGPTCGRAMVWGLDEDGKSIPLVSAQLYEVVEVQEAGGQLRVRRIRDMADGVALGGKPAPRYLISHFKDCPDANRFGKDKVVRR